MQALTLRTLLPVTCAALAACAQRPLDELLDRERARALDLPALADGGGERPLSDVTAYFPLLDGARWTYSHSEPGENPRLDTVTLAALDGPEPSYELSTERGDGQTEVERWSWSGTRLARTTRLESEDGAPVRRTDYAPGQLRFDRAWTERDLTETVSYTRTETGADGAVSRDERREDFRVLSVAAEVRVPFGALGPCLLIERRREGERTWVWFAEGIGRVKELEEESQALDELTLVRWP